MIARLAHGLAALSLLFAPVPAAADGFKTPIAAGYQPQDKDERGLWMRVGEVERELRTSDFMIRDPALNAYVRGVLCRTVGEAECAPVRLLLIRTADFNAGMYPTGLMLVNSGLLLRMQNEAQLAAVLGHEFTHYSHRHSLQSFRDAKRKTSAMAWLSMMPVGGYAAAAALTLAQIGLLSSFFRFTRAMEAEADAGSVPLMANAGYRPGEAARVWEQLRAEQDATAAARNKRSRKNDGGIFATHPPSAERVAALSALSAKQPHSAAATDGRAAFRSGMRAWWPALIDDQIKLNDFGGTEFLLGKLAADGWTPELHYARGELHRSRGRPEDLVKAAGFYREAIASGEPPVEAWRGLGLSELRGGRAEEGRAALREYLARKPDAHDKSMMTMLLGESV